MITKWVETWFLYLTMIPSIASAWRADWQSYKVWVASESPMDLVCCWACGAMGGAVPLTGGVPVDTEPRISFFIFIAAALVGDPSNAAGVRSALDNATAIGKIFNHCRMLVVVAP